MNDVPHGRFKKSNEMQQYADICLLLNYSTCFGRPSHPSSGVHKTVVAASGTDHTLWGASFLKCDQISPYLVTFEEACSSDICTLLHLDGFLQPRITMRGTTNIKKVPHSVSTFISS